MNGWWRAGIVVGVGIVAGMLVVSSPGAQTPSSSLFENGPEVAAMRPHAASARSRRVSINRALLSALASGRSRTVRLNLFGGLVLDADALRFQATGNTLTWVGRVRGQSGTVHISTVGNAIACQIESREGSFTISLDADGTPVVEQLDPSRFPSDARDQRTPPWRPSRQTDVAVPPKSADDGSQIDVLFLYTTTARTNAGSVAAIQAVINNAISVTNQAYIDSGVTQRINAVGPGAPGPITAIELTGYAQDGDIGGDLDNITGYPTVTAISPTVLGYRKTYAADLVQLVADYGATASCGVGWLNPNSPSNEVFGYSVAERLCADSNKTTPHEMGHNQGLKHAHEEDGSDSSGYGVIAYGFKAPDHSFRTIMAYLCNDYSTALDWQSGISYSVNTLVKQGGSRYNCKQAHTSSASDAPPNATFWTLASCPRVGRFSNPNPPLYNGQVTGVAGTGTNAADNVSALNGSRVTVSNWRTHRATPTATISGTPTPTRTPTSTATRTNTPTATSTPGPGASFYSVPPCRVLNTLRAPDVYGGPALMANAGRTFTMSGLCLIPTSAKVISANVTVTMPTSAGNLRIYPAGQPLPQVAVINFAAGQTRANNALLGLSPSGQIVVYDDQAAGNTVHFIVDVNGYFE